MPRKTIVSRFNWLIVLAVVLSVLVTSVTITAYLLHLFVRDVREKDTLHIKGLSASVKGFVDNAFSLNYHLSINPIIIDAVTNADPDWQRRLQQYEILLAASDQTAHKGLPLLEHLQSKYSFVELFFVQDIEGNQVGRSFGALGQRGQRWWYKEFMGLRQRRPFISKSYYSLTGDKPVASAFHGIYDEDVLVGIMGTDINFDKLQELVQNYLNSEDLYAVVLDNQGVIIAHPDHKKLRELYNLRQLTKKILIRSASGQSVLNASGYHETIERPLNWDPQVAQVVTAVLSGQSGYAEDMMMDGARCTLYYDPVPLPEGEARDKNFAVLLIRDNSTLWQPMLAICVFALMVTLLLLLGLTAAFRMQFQRRVLKPLAVLTASMRSADAVHLEEERLRADDEFHLMARAYNEMRRNLAAANQQLAQGNTELERRVAQRTAELQAANAQLHEDIKARHDAEAALRVSEERYRLTLEAAPDAISITRLEDGRLLMVNDTFCRMFGLSKEAIVDKSGVELKLYEDANEREYYLQRLLNEGDISNCELARTLADGTVLHIMASARLINYGKERSIITVLKDISERKRMEQALRDSEEKYRQLVNNAADGIFIYQNGQIKFSNPRAVEISRDLGFELDQLPPLQQASSPAESTTDEPPSATPAKDASAVVTYSLRLVSKKGKELWMELNTIPTDWEGRSAILGFLRDITLPKKLEIQNQRNQRLKGISTLAGGIAHEFNNLLMGIQGNASLIMLQSEADSYVYRRALGIEQSVEEAAELTRQLLGFAREGKYMVEPTNLNELVKTTAQRFGRTRDGITIYQQLADDLWAVDVDRQQIEQVLLNIYANAGQAMPDGGDLSLQTVNAVLSEREVRPYDQMPGRFVHVSIADTGTGMDETTRQRIFEPFYTTRGVGKGSGLGLASAFGIIKNHEGIIDVTSQPGQGTTFHIYLPASHREAEMPSTPPMPLQRGAETILLVDDEEMIIEVNRPMLEELGYNVVVARGGASAIDLFQKHHSSIELVILDMVMPDIDGGQVFDRLRAIQPQIKVLLSSGYSLAGQAEKIMARGCNAFIQKPFDLQTLSRKIREVLDEKAGVPPEPEP